MPNFKILIPGKSLYKYELLSLIDSGSFAQIWLVNDRSLEKNIALKILKSSESKINDDLKEAVIGNQLNHPNLIKIHYADVINDNGNDYVLVAMDFQNKGSILNQLNTRGFLSIPDGIKYIIDILKGLEYLHEKGFYHGDIKPKNILVGNRSEGKLSDYGITCFSPDQQGVKPKLIYYPHIAPEVISDNQITIQTDIYQVGLTLFRLLNGIEFLKNKYDILGFEEYAELVRLGNLISDNEYQLFIPTQLKKIIKKSTHHTASERYKTALELRRALEQINYPGFWTSNKKGELNGRNGNYTYRFEKILNKKGHEFIALKKNVKSKIETRIIRFCKQFRRKTNLFKT